MTNVVRRLTVLTLLMLALSLFSSMTAAPVGAQPPECADLYVRSFTVTNPTTEGANATVQIQIENQGTCATLSFVVQFKADDNGPVVWSTEVASLTAGGTSGDDVTLTFNYAYPTAGNFTSMVIVDSDRVVLETNENNNQEIFDVTVLENKPDLYISNFTVAPDNPLAGETTFVNITVSNAGPVASGPFIVQWQHDRFAPEGPSQQVDNVPAFQSRTVSFQYIFPQPGDYQTQVNVDTNRTVVESDEENNLEIFAVQVAEAKPDLAITGFEVGPQTPLPPPDATYPFYPPNQPVVGENARIRVRVTNEGPVPSVSFVVQWKSDEFAPLGASTATVPGLAPGESKWVELVAVFRRAGNYETIVEIDTDKTVGESDEMNNIQITPVTVQERVQDVAVILFTVEPANPSLASEPIPPSTTLNPVVNRDTTAKVVVRNLGNVPVNSFFVEWKPAPLEAGRNQQIVSGLNPGATQTLTWNFIYRNPGTFSTSATADSTDLVRPEANDANNVKTMLITVEPELPDLIITQFSINPPSPVAGTEAELISTFTVKVRNRGNSPAGPFDVRVKPTPLADPSPHQVGAGLGVHQEITLHFTTVYRFPGTFNAVATVDPPIQRVQELNEENNTSNLQVVVQPPTDDLDVIDIDILRNPSNENQCDEGPGDFRDFEAQEFGKATLYQGEPVKVCIYIQNYGNSPMRQFMVQWNPAEGAFPPLNSEGPGTIQKQVDELGAGAVALLQFDFVYERAGEFRTLTFADSGNVIGETNEENNREIYNVEVLATGPDLTILDLNILTFFPEGDFSGQQVAQDVYQLRGEQQIPIGCVRDRVEGQVSAQANLVVLQDQKIFACVIVKNQGDRPSGPFVTEWNPDAFGLLTNGPATVSTQVDNLNAGESIVLIFGFTYTQAGDFRTIAKADAFNDVPELQEADNEKILNVTVAPTGPDLDIISMSIQSLGGAQAAVVEPVLQQGVPARVTITVRNNGSRSAGPFLVEWNPAEGASPPLITNGPSTLEKQVNGLAAGSQVNVTFDFTYDRHGGFRTLAKADSTNTVEEINEDNNLDILNVVVNPANIDLTITNVVVNNGSNPIRGSKVPVRITIRNTGTYPTGSFSLQFKPNGPDANGPQMRIDGLHAGETRTVELEATYFTAGPFTSQAVIDIREEIIETNENNNTFNRSVNVNPRETVMNITMNSVHVDQGDGDDWYVVTGVLSPGKTCNPEFDGDPVLPEPLEDVECTLTEAGEQDNGDTFGINKTYQVTLLESTPVVILAFAVEVDPGGIFDDTDVTQRGLAFKLWTNRDYRGVGSDSIQALLNENPCCYDLNYSLNIVSEPPPMALGAEELPPPVITLSSSWASIWPAGLQLPAGVQIAPADPGTDPNQTPGSERLFLPHLSRGDDSGASSAATGAQGSAPTGLQASPEANMPEQLYVPSVPND